MGSRNHRLFIASVFVIAGALTAWLTATDAWSRDALGETPSSFTEQGRRVDTAPLVVLSGMLTCEPDRVPSGAAVFNAAEAAATTTAGAASTKNPAGAASSSGECALRFLESTHGQVFRLKAGESVGTLYRSGRRAVTLEGRIFPSVDPALASTFEVVRSVELENSAHTE